jgi:hypothetical protein
MEFLTMDPVGRIAEYHSTPLKYEQYFILASCFQIASVTAQRNA